MNIKKIKPKTLILIILLSSILLIIFFQTGISNRVVDFITGKATTGYGRTSDETQTNTLIQTPTQTQNPSETTTQTTFSTETQTYYLIDLSYSNNEFKITNSSLEKGNTPTLKSDNKEFKIKLLSETDELLYSNSFANPGLVFSDGLEKGEVIQSENINFYIAFPNLENTFKFQIRNKDEKVILETFIKDL